MQFYRNENLMLPQTFQRILEFAKFHVIVLILCFSSSGSSLADEQFFDHAVQPTLQNDGGKIVQVKSALPQADELKILSQENDILSKHLRAKRIFAYSLIILVIVLFACFYAYYRFFHREKANMIILEQQKIRIEKQAVELEKLNKVKDRLFSILAHDLKGPLDSLQGMVRLIQEDNLSREEFESFLPLVSQNLNNNSNLLENLLVWSRGQMKGIQAEQEKINLHHLVQKNLRFLSDSNYFKGQILSNCLPKQVFVKADKNMVDIVLRNLLTNALKFTRKDDIIRIDLVEEDNLYTLCVTDHGVGMKEESLQKLFGYDFFSTPGTHQEKGTGIGLMLSKELVQKNKGDIWAESEFGKGSTFCFSLPKL